MAKRPPSAIDDLAALGVDPADVDLDPKPKRPPAPPPPPPTWPERNKRNNVYLPPKMRHDVEQRLAVDQPGVTFSAWVRQQCETYLAQRGGPTRGPER